MADETKMWTEKRQAHVARGVGNMSPFFITRAEGALLTDVDGREYIDFAGGIGVQNIGHRHPKVVAAIKDQTDRYIHSCFHVMMYQPYVELCEKLNAIVPVKGPAKTMLANSGAEAVENAVKIARCRTGRTGVIAFRDAFHGRTYLAMALTSKVNPYKVNLGAVGAPGVFRADYPYCYRCPWGKTYPECDLYCGETYFETDFFKHHVSPEETAAIILEPVQGEGGFIHPPKEYYGHLRRICDKYGIVLISDEIQTGFGRTGTMFATEQYEVKADIITSGKSLAAGLPLSAVTGSADVMDSVHPGGLGGTYGGNPLSCAAALAVLEIMEQEDILSQGRAMGDKVRAELDRMAVDYPLIGQIRGLGPMLAVELVKDRETKEPAAEETKAVVKYCHDHGLIILDCGTLGNNIRFLTPLSITAEQLDRGLGVFRQALAEVN